jgi:flagellar hook-length control protein FliK
LEPISTVATPPSLMKLKTELGKNSTEKNPKSLDQGKFSEVLRNQAEKKPLESKENEGFRAEKREIQNRDEPLSKTEPKENKPEFSVKRFQSKGQSDRLMSEREKAILKFMDSFESEFGIPPQEMVVAMAGLSQEQMTMAPEETADTVIAKLKLDDRETEKAQQAYLGFLTQLNLIDSKAQRPSFADANVGFLTKTGEGEQVSLMERQGLDSDKLRAGMQSQLKSGGNGTFAPSEGATLLDQNGNLISGEIDQEDFQGPGGPMNELGDSKNAQAFLKPKVRERVLASLERKAERDLSVQSLNDKFWMRGPQASTQDLPIQSLTQVRNLEGGKVMGDEILEPLLAQLKAQESLPGSEIVGSDGQILTDNLQSAKREDPLPFMVARENAEANSKQRGNESFQQSYGGDGNNGNWTNTNDKSIRGKDQKKVNVEDMNFRQMADALGGDRSASSGQNLGTSKLGNHIGGDGLMTQRPSYDNEANVKEIMNQAQYLVKNGGGEMKVKMTPEGLGELQLKVVVADGKVNVQMVTETKEAKNAIESSLSELKNSLSAQKLSVEHVRIDVVGSTNAENKTDHGMNSNPNAQRDSTRQFWNQFQESFGNRSQRDGLFDMSSKGYASRKERDPLQPITAPASARRASGKGSGLNLVA